MIKQLFETVTISEAAWMWDRHPMTVRRAIDTGKKPLIARRSGDPRSKLGDESGVYIISVESLIRRWGKPVREFTC